MDRDAPHIFEDRDIWSYFKSYLFESNRFILNSCDLKRFIQAVIAEAKKRTFVLQIHRLLKRAQLIYKEDCRIDISKVDNGFCYSSRPLPIERMTPNPEMTSAGRLNPLGISYLYLANNARTAIAEVRPWIGAKICVESCKVTRNQNLVDFCGFLGLKGAVLIDRAGWKRMSLDDKTKAIWIDIARDLSTPISPNEFCLGYVPTQYLAEVFKTNGFDGIRWQSSVNIKGECIVLFDKNSAVPLCPRCTINYEISSVLYKYGKDSFDISSPHLRKEK